MDLARRAKASKLHFVIPTQGFEVSPGSTPLGGRVKMKDVGQPPMDYTLQARPGV